MHIDQTLFVSTVAALVAYDLAKAVLFRVVNWWPDSAVRWWLVRE